ncbi:MAG: hypothetical protein ACFFE4_00375 [Candidatus Thorarchaeota archaeon]
MMIQNTNTMEYSRKISELRLLFKEIIEESKNNNSIELTKKIECDFFEKVRQLIAIVAAQNFIKGKNSILKKERV